MWNWLTLHLEKHDWKPSNKWFWTVCRCCANLVPCDPIFGHGLGLNCINLCHSVGRKCRWNVSVSDIMLMHIKTKLTTQLTTESCSMVKVNLFFSNWKYGSLKRDRSYSGLRSSSLFLFFRVRFICKIINAWVKLISDSNLDVPLICSPITCGDQKHPVVI